MNLIVKIDDVARTHANATEACRFSDSALLRCAVNMDASIARFLVLRFHSAQPDHSRNDWVAARRIHGNDFTGRNPVLDYCAGRQSITYLC